MTAEIFSKNFFYRLVTWLLLSFALAVFIGACSKEKAPHALPPIPVVTAAAIQKNIPVQIDAIGTVEAYQTISVRTQITGQITKVYFNAGQDVRKGDRLFALDCRTYDAALKQAEANLIRDKAQAKNAEEELHRYTYLVEKGYVAREQYDQVRTNWAALEATVKADGAVVESNRVQIQYCSIYSPISGRIGSLKVDEGNIVKVNDTEVVVINQIRPINVTFAIPEKDLPRVKKYRASGNLAVDAMIPEDEHPEKGILTFVDNAVDRTTGTITLKGTFANRETRLWPGQFVNVIMTLAIEPNVVMIPSQALEKGQTGDYVFVVDPDAIVEMRPVTIGPVIQGETVILKGIRAGERVVTDGQLRLTPGVKVTSKEAH